MQKKIMKNNSKGITLIALVITIILLVILATISINTVLGDNGLIQRAEQAERINNEKKELERLELVKGEVAIKSAEDGKGGKYTVADYVARLIAKGITTSSDVTINADGSQSIITDTGYSVDIIQDGERNVIFAMNGKANNAAIRITKIDTTPNLTRKEIGVNVTVIRADGASYEYYYKKASEPDTSYILANTSSNTNYTITGREASGTGLKEDTIYTIKVVAKDSSGTSTITKNATIKGIPVAEGAIKFGDFNWASGKASTTVTKEITDDYTIKYKVANKAGTEIVAETTITSGGTIADLSFDDIITVWLTDGTNVGAAADLTVTENIEPKDASISLSGATTAINKTITAIVTQSDDESGVELANCKWVYTTEINPDESKYTGTFSSATSDTISLTTTTLGDYYLYVLTVDKAGNKHITKSSKVTVELPPSAEGNITLGNFIWTNGKASTTVTIPEDISNNYTVKYKVENEEGTETIAETTITSGGTIADLSFDDIITVWLTDGTNVGNTATFTVQLDLVNIYGQGLYLFNNGDVCEEVTGGWLDEYYSGTSESLGSSSITDTLNVSTWGTWCAYRIRTKNKIDLSQFTKLVFVIEEVSGCENKEYGGISYGYMDDEYRHVCHDLLGVQKNIVVEFELPSSNGFPMIACGNTASVKVSQVFLVK